jgi:hypothetical protein
MDIKAKQDSTVTDEASKVEPTRSEKYRLGEKMVVDFLGKPYQLGVCILYAWNGREKLTLSFYRKPTYFRKPSENILLSIRYPATLVLASVSGNATY